MNRTAWAGICACLTLVGLTAPAAQGQVKPAVGAEEKRAFTPGDIWTVTLREGKTVLGKQALKGRVVAVDATAVYLRPGAGEPVQRIRRADISAKQSDLLVRGDMLAKISADPIKFAKIDDELKQTGFLDLDQQWANTPREILQVEVIEGTERRVHYLASPLLSASEKTRLAEIESAESDLGRANGLVELQQQYLRNERALEPMRFQAMNMYYQYCAQTALGFYPATLINNISPYFPRLVGAFLPETGYYGPYWWQRSVMTGPPVPDEGAMKTALLANSAKHATPEAHAAAKTNLAKLTSQALYQNGQLVAVSFEDSQAKPAKTGRQDRGTPAGAVGHDTADDEPAYKSGDRVTVTSKGRQPLHGTVVRSDERFLVLRTQPSLPPTTLLWSNIELVEPWLEK
jgi:hypothetical protein